MYTARIPPSIIDEVQNHTLSYVKDMLSDEAKMTLANPITYDEFFMALKGMAKGKSLTPDGIILEFYIEYWSLIGKEYWEMIKSSILSKQLLNVITKGMIALLHKGGTRTAVRNWRPITLLNISYKIYAKALQLRLQPILMDIINPEQSAFLSLRFILDNLLLTYETTASAEKSKQSLFFLK